MTKIKQSLRGGEYVNNFKSCVKEFSSQPKGTVAVNSSSFLFNEGYAIFTTISYKECDVNMFYFRSRLHK